MRLTKTMEKIIDDYENRKTSLQEAVMNAVIEMAMLKNEAYIANHNASSIVHLIGEVLEGKRKDQWIDDIAFQIQNLPLIDDGLKKDAKEVEMLFEQEQYDEAKAKLLKLLPKLICEQIAAQKIEDECNYHRTELSMHLSRKNKSELKKGFEDFIEHIKDILR